MDTLRSSPRPQSSSSSVKAANNSNTGSKGEMSLNGAVNSANKSRNKGAKKGPMKVRIQFYLVPRPPWDEGGTSPLISCPRVSTSL